MLLARFIIEGHSMEPTFRAGSVVVASGIPYLFLPPKVGDVVVVINPSSKKPMIKRIRKVENDRYYVFGDNEKDSLDSRTFGRVSRNHILGKVLFCVGG